MIVPPGVCPLNSPTLALGMHHYKCEGGGGGGGGGWRVQKQGKNHAKIKFKGKEKKAKEADKRISHCNVASLTRRFY